MKHPENTKLSLITTTTPYIKKPIETGRMMPLNVIYDLQEQTLT